MIRTEVIHPIHVLLARHAAERPDKIAFEDDHGAVAYGALDAATASVAGRMAEAGLAPGERVAIYLPNSVAWAEACLAILRAGGVAVPIAYESAPGEVRYRLKDADCRFVLTQAEKLEIVVGADGVSPTPILLDGDDGLSYPAMRRGGPAPRDPDDIDGASFIVYTSGTTGQPKGVRLSLRSLLWVTASAWMLNAGIGPEDVILSPLPLFHSYALSLSVLTVAAVGATERIMPRFSTEQALDLLATGRFTVFPGVPTMFHYLIEAGRERSDKPKGLRLCISAGAIMPATLNQAFEDIFGATLLDGYGITETATMVAFNWPNAPRVLGSCGVPVIGLTVRIVDPATDLDRAVGEEGKLIVRGPSLMLGYHEKPEETAKALKGGWYRTGDLAVADANGFLTITGRLKELIIRGGQNIAPAEIEEAANAFSGVLDCAVVGEPHEHLGEVPAIYVVPRPGEDFSADALIAHCQARLSAYKVPSAVHVTDAIPRTGSGKIMRYRLGAD